MSFDPSSISEVVDELLACPKGSTQPFLRCATNRIYYWSYGLLRKRLVSEFDTDCFQGRGKHTLLYNFCVHHHDQGIFMVGKILQALCVAREMADYSYDDQDAPTLQAVRTWRIEATRAAGRIKMLAKPQLQLIHNRLSMSP